MKSKRIAIALVLLAALVAGIYATKKYNLEKKISGLLDSVTFKKNEEGKLEFINPDDIVEIYIRNPSGAKAMEKDENNHWFITKPVRARLDDVWAKHLPNKLAGLFAEKVVETEPKDLAKYMLDNPDIVVQFRLKGSDKMNTLEFGMRIPTESQYYAYNPDEKKVYIVEFGVKFDFNGTVNEYMSKKIFQNNPREADKTVFDYKDVKYEFVNKPEYRAWFMTSPEKRKMSLSGFPTLVGNMWFLEMSRMLFPPDLPEDTGLDDPDLTITFIKTGDWIETLIIGKEAGGGTRYAKKGDSEDIFLVPDYIYSYLTDNMDKASPFLAAFFGRERIKRLKFIKGDKSLVFYRNSENDPWKLEGMENAEVDEGTLMDTVYKIRAIKGRGYVNASVEDSAAEYGLDKPAATVEIESFLERIAPFAIYYGKKDPTGKFVYSYNLKDPYILKVDAYALDLIPSSPDKYLKK